MWLPHVIHMQAGRKDSLETPVNKRSQQKWVRNVQWRHCKNIPNTLYWRGTSTVYLTSFNGNDKGFHFLAKEKEL